jgi:SAM-dependent methyltransferase
MPIRMRSQIVTGADPARAPGPGARVPDKYELYELCVQAPRSTARFLHAVHGRSPTLLREDFSGAAGICRAWVREWPGARAVAVDQDPEPLARCGPHPRLTRVHADVRDAPHPADVLCALNFPLGYWHARADLISYLRLCARRLRRGGVFVADTYGGRRAADPGTYDVAFRTRDGIPVRYRWEQRSHDAVTGRVENAIHFRVGAGRRAAWMRDAFVYRWRLWSLPELRDAYEEAGFTDVRVYDTQDAAVDHLGRWHVTPVEPGTLSGDMWVVCVTGRVGRRGRS